MLPSISSPVAQRSYGSILKNNGPVARLQEETKEEGLQEAASEGTTSASNSGCLPNLWTVLKILFTTPSESPDMASLELPAGIEKKVSKSSNQVRFQEPETNIFESSDNKISINMGALTDMRFANTEMQKRLAETYKVVQPLSELSSLSSVECLGPLTGLLEGESDREELQDNFHDLIGRFLRNAAMLEDGSVQGLSGKRQKLDDSLEKLKQSLEESKAKLQDELNAQNKPLIRSLAAGSVQYAAKSVDDYIKSIETYQEASRRLISTNKDLTPAS